MGPLLIRVFACWICCVVVGMGTGGCGSAAAPSRASLHVDRVDGWVVSQGGTLGGQQQSRVERALATLSTIDSQQVQVGVLNSPTVCAFAWPDGRLFVTRGLLDLVDDDELVAAIAHEVGHLVADGHVEAPAALRGPSHGSAEAVEVAADRAARAILARAGRSDAPLIRLLDSLAGCDKLSAAQQQSFRRRCSQVRAASTLAS